MSKFEIITITLSFIIGFGIAQLLSSFGAAVRDRLEHPLHWMPFAWGVVILVFSLQYWFAVFDLDHALGDWSWLWYSQMLALAVVLFMAGSLILPTRVTLSGNGLLEDFIIHGRYSLLALAVYVLGWIPANAFMDNGNVFSEANWFNVAMATAALVAYKSTSIRVWIVTTVMFYMIFAYALFAVYSAPGL